MPLTTQQQLDALSTRVALLDGIGLAEPRSGFVSVTERKLAGVKEDLAQSVITLEKLLVDMTAAINAYAAALAAATGTQPLILNSDTVVPPAG